MPVNSRPPWLKDRLETVNKAVPPAWTRKASVTPATDTKESSPSTKIAPAATGTSSPTKTPSTAPKENGEAGAKTSQPVPATTTAKLQSKEIKVPVVVTHKKPVAPPLSKPEPKTTPLKNTTPVMTVLREPAKPKSAPQKAREPTPESEEDEEAEEEEEEEIEEEEEEEGSTEYETETESEEEASPPPPPKSSVKKPDPSQAKKVEKEEEPKLLAPLRKVTPTKSSDKSESDSKASSKSASEKSSSPEPRTFVKPLLKKVVRPQQEAPAKERSVSPEPAKNFRVQLRKVPSNLKAPRVKEKLPEVQLKKVEKPLLEDIPKKEEAYPHKPSMLKSESSKRIPPPPPMPKSNIPPPPPPPPGLKAPPDFEKKEISDKQKDVLDKLKRRPRRRPDWSDMMKEVEQGRKLRHVQCNDRSHPIINSKSITKVKDQFIFETEKATAHNQLLKQIQGGVMLKPTKCNDRSKPILGGLRKFRRQMTLEEQLAKSESRANMEAPPADEEEDELDDIDKVRDDLQSTKQMLAHELRNNEALERENKRLQARVQNLEAELSRERWNPLSGEERSTVTGPQSDLIQSLKDEALEAQKQSHQLEQKYQTVAKELDTAYKLGEEQKRKIAELEKKLQCLTDDDYYLNEHQGNNVPDVRRATESAQKESSPELQPDEEEEEEEEEDEEKKAEKLAKRLNREVNMLQARLTRLKEKQEEKHAERQALKYAMKTNQYALKAERKKYKKLQKEVEKMAAMMKMEDDDESSAESKEPPPEDPEEEPEEEEEEESESEESESESENESENEAEDAADEKKKINLEPRVKRHEARLASLKKGNYILQANVDRIKDEISKVREECCTLQTDLDNVIADLG
uniref:WH2 domain-containing protein n=1 Tax=Anopheles atroparvus TaxID=41427 RepID=A0AAG5D4J5_ANOAO